MAFDINTAMTWILFLALFPMAFFWLRRAWRIIVRRNFSEVALKRGVAPTNPGKFAPYAAALNLAAGAVALTMIVAVVGYGLAYETWTAIAGSTLWLKFFGDFILGRHAHPSRPESSLAGRA
jgi:ABC-type phosphate transport system permease subunit